jgi:glycosyltransferase involved in cell wall biosynthesis
VQVIHPRQQQTQDDDGIADTVLVRGMGLPRYPGLQFGLPATRRLRALWKSKRPDAIYVATEGPLGWSALRVARALGIPACTGFHTRFDIFVRHYGFGWLAPTVLGYLRRFHNRADATLVPTVELKEFLDRSGFENVVLLHRGVDTVLFSPTQRSESLRRQWGLDANSLAIIYVGRIAPEKNLQLAVRAFRALQKSRPEARYIWIGDGPARAALAAQNPDFVFVGVQLGTVLAQHYASADLFLFPSVTETFGNVTLEAMASGLPTVAFDYGAAHEHLRDDCGRRVPFANDDAFVETAVALACGDATRASMRTAARAAVSGLAPQAVATSFARLLAGLRRPHGASSGAAASNGEAIP